MIRVVAVCLLLSIGDAGASRGQEPAKPASSSKVVDAGHLFSPEAVKEAETSLVAQESATKIAVLIETVDSLDGAMIEQAALRAARTSGTESVFLLIAKKEHQIAPLLVKPPVDRVLPKDQREAIRNSMLEEFKRGKFDLGLKIGVDRISEALRTGAVVQKTIASLVAPGPDRLTLKGAQIVMRGAEAKAAALNQKTSLAIVDIDGQLLTFARMDGARQSSIAQAQSLATTFVNTPFDPGQPMADFVITFEGQILGAIGVANAPSEMTRMIAKAGLAELAEALKAEKTAPSDSKPFVP